MQNIQPSPLQRRLFTVVNRALMTAPKPTQKLLLGELVETSLQDVQDALLLIMYRMGIGAPPEYLNRQKRLVEADDKRRENQSKGIARAKRLKEEEAQQENKENEAKQQDGNAGNGSLLHPALVNRLNQIQGGNDGR